MANKPYYGKYSSALTVSHNKGTRTVSSRGQYKELIEKEIELDNTDGFVGVFEVDTDLTSGYKTISANKGRDFNAMLIENNSDAAVELLYTTGRFTDNSSAADTYDADDSLTTFIPAGSYTYIQNPRILVYEHDLASGNPSSSMNAVTGDTTSHDPTYVTDSGVSITASTTAAYDSTTLTVGDSDVFAPGDILLFSPFGSGINASTGAIDFEAVRVKSITNTTTIEVERGVLGTDVYAHAHTDVSGAKLYFYGGNEHVPIAFMTANTLAIVASTATDTGGAMATITDSGNGFINAGFIPGMFVSLVKNATDWNDDAGIITEVTAGTLTVHRFPGTLTVQTAGDHYALTGYWAGTDKNGKYKNNTFLGAATRSSNHIQGLVPGGQYIDLPVPVSQRLGLNNLNQTTSSGLTASTAYNFALNLDGQRETITFTTDASNTNWGGVNGVISKIRAALNTKIKDGSLYRNVSVVLENGDIVFKSHVGGGDWNGYCTNRGTDHKVRSGASQIDIQKVGSGNEFLGSGNVPGVMQPATSNEFKEVETLHPNTNEIINDYSNMLIDRGDGTLKRNLGGHGTINYESGALELEGLPPWSQLQGYYIKDSAHCGQLDTKAGESRNGINKVFARSVNAKANALVKITILA
tara:strand:+ start:397 stop:2313 length:1917 start_codon:yes stop_codon:yes gene_type:complete